jgi:flagellar hook assembly protein FlgD
LFDNFVRTIAIDDNTGEVFIGSDKGVVSYQGDAIVGKRLNSINPRVFPNPVRPEYEGPITIRGLAVNANVKITDVNGKLVYETEALGGQAIWDGRDYNGRKVQTGIYLVLSTTNPREIGLGNPDAVVAKVVFIN